MSDEEQPKHEAPTGAAEAVAPSDLDSTRISQRRIAARREPAVVMDLTQVSQRRAQRGPRLAAQSAAAESPASAGPVPGTLSEDEAFPTQSDPEVTRPSARRRGTGTLPPGGPSGAPPRGDFQPTAEALAAMARTPVRVSDESSKPVLRFGPGWGAVVPTRIERTPEEIALRRFERGRNFALGTLAAMVGTVVLILAGIWFLSGLRF